MTSTLLYDKACIAAEKARALRTKFKTKGLSVPDELYWYNNNTNWNALSRKEFRDIMIRMESITAQHYEDFGTGHHRSAAIKKFWADEWGCEYLPETGQWFDLATRTFIESETEKKAQRDAKKAQEKAEKAEKAEKKAAKKAQKAQAKAVAKQVKQEQGQYNDEEEELYRQALDQQQQQQQPQPHDYDYYDWCYDEAEEAYAEAYAKARAAEELQEQQAAEAYLEDQGQGQDQDQDQEQLQRVACQPVFYFEEQTNVKGDPDWRAFIYYDDDIRRYVFKGTRRSLRATSRKTRYPEIKLCFHSSRELANFLCSSTDNKLNVTMFAMTTATVKEATFADLYTLPVRGDKTELFGYDDTCPSYHTFVDYLRMLSDVDVAHSDFANFLAY